MATARKSAAYVIPVLAVCCFTLGCSQQFIMGIPSVMADSMGVGVAEVGQLMTVFAMSNAIGTPIVLALTGKWQQRSQMIAGLVLMALGMGVMAASDDYPLLLVARAVMGVGNGTFVATAYAVATVLAKPGKQGSAIANVGLGFSFSQVLAMPIARTLVVLCSWHVFYAVLAAIAAAAIVVIRLNVPASDVHLAEIGWKERMSPLRNPYVCAALACMMCLNIGYSSFYTYVTPYLEGVFGTAGGTVSLVLLVSALMSAVGSKGSGWLADHAGVKVTTLIALGLQISSYLFLGAFSPFVNVVAVTMCIWVMADWSFNPAENVLLSKFAGSAAPLVLGLSNSALQLGNAAGAALGGAFIATQPTLSLPYLSAGAAVIGLILQLYVLSGYAKLHANDRIEILSSR